MIANRRLQCAVPIILLAASVLGGAGCGAMFGSKRRTVTITSVPAGAEAIVDGQLVGYTPVQVSLTDDRPHEVLFRSGQVQTVCRIESEIDATWLILDILTFPIGVVVDAVTGDWKELDKSRCHALLPAAAPPPGYAPPGYAPPPGQVPYQGYPPQNVAPPGAPGQGLVPPARQ
ncbi:MAG: PEGA domain-containing protein [Deltaproteobacteria bacterium]|nr:PEGA domain-containing protein [Deltaproteobacteria bacterium]